MEKQSNGEKLTERQEEYLLYFASRKAGKGVSDVAQNFGISKASASVACTALEKCGMVIKPDGGGIMLTEAGEAYIAGKLQTARQVAACLSAQLGLEPCVAAEEARKLVVTLRGETVALMLSHWGHPEGEGPAPAEELNLERLPLGVYQVPFEVRKAGKQERSMGDKGFLKPAELIHTEKERVFCLRASQFSYKPVHRKILDGALERLWYQIGDAWYESRETEQGCHEIPERAIRFFREVDKVMGVIRIRARATVGLRKMPESEADVVFCLEDLRRWDKPLTGFGEGVYQVPFDLHRAGETTPVTMSQAPDSPAEIEVMERGSTIFLRPEQLVLRTDRGREAALDRLWYQVDGNWHESCRERTGCFGIPDSALYIREGDHRLGMARILVRLDAGTRRMPEYEADLVIHLDEIRNR